MSIKYLIIILLVLSALCLLVTSCQYPADSDIVEHTYICGDGICDSYEFDYCDADCHTIKDAEPKIKVAEVVDNLKSIRKIYTSEERLEQNNSNPIVEQDQLIIEESFTEYLPSKGFRVISAFNLLSLDENISDVMGVVNRFTLPEILRSGRMSSSTEMFGNRATFYEQFLRLKNGKVVFGYEPDSDSVTTYLKYEDEEPILEYSIQLSGGIFKFFEGSEIHFLGHDYFIQGVTPSLITLEGVTTPDVITLRNRSSSIINGKTVPSSILNVTLTDESLVVVLNSEKDINILPGTGLREYLSMPEAMLTNRLDIEYQGLTEVPTYDIVFDRTSYGYRLFLKTNKDLNYKIPLLNFNPFRAGDRNNRLVYQEGENSDDYFIHEDDYFLIGNDHEFNGLTNMLIFKKVKENDNLIVFEDPALETFLIYYEGTPGVNATANLIVDNRAHKIYVGENNTLSIDLNGDGRINSDIIPLVGAGNSIINILNISISSMELNYVVPGELREDTNDDLKIRLTLSNEGITINPEDLEMIKPEYEDVLIGLSQYGSSFVLKRNVDRKDQTGDELLIKHPIYQRFVDVILKAYE